MSASEHKQSGAGDSPGGALASRLRAGGEPDGSAPGPAPAEVAPETLRILHVEDDPFIARLMREILTQAEHMRFSVRTAATLASGLEELAAEPVDVLLLDLSLPDSRGLDTVERVRAHSPTVPIVVLSGHDDERLALAALKLGAQDYLVKGQADARLVVRAIRYAMERKRADEELARERDLLHSLLNNIPDRIYFKDAASRFVRVNRTMARKFGLGEPEEAVGRSDADFFPPDLARDLLADEQRLLRTGEPIINKVERQTTTDGSQSWASVTKVPTRGRDGQVTGLVGISRDITALKQLETSLGEERALLRSLVDHLPDYIYVLDAAGRFLLANDAFHQLTRAVTSERLLGQTAAELFPAAVGAALQEDDLAVMRSSQPVLHREEACRLGEVEDCWLSTTKVPLRDAASKRVVGLVVISHDITRRLRARRQLQSANAELQGANAALRDTRMQLLHAERLQSVGRLAAGVAHEVKNPLAVLRLGLDYFLALRLPPEEAETAELVLEDMQSAIQRANTIIMGMLDFSAPGELCLKPVEINHLLDHALSLVRHELNTNGHVVERQVGPAAAFALLDAQKISQVLINLLTNAFHAMPRGGKLVIRTGVRPIAEAEAGHDAGSREGARFRTGEEVVQIEIDDTGCGIPPDQLDKIFDPFFTTKETGKGTGLGLTVARKIVELHGGSLTINNRPEGGVRSTLLLKATQETP